MSLTDSLVAQDSFTFTIENSTVTHAFTTMVGMVSDSFTSRVGLPVSIPRDQLWFWTDEWQSREREADDDIANGRLLRFSSVADLRKALDAS